MAQSAFVLSLSSITVVVSHGEKEVMPGAALKLGQDSGVLTGALKCCQLQGGGKGGQRRGRARGDYPPAMSLGSPPRINTQYAMQ